MRLYLFVFLYGIIAASLEGTVLQGIRPLDSISVDLFIMAVAAITFNEQWESRAWSLFILGAFKDASSALPFGTSIISYIVVSFVLRALHKTISFQTGIASAFWTFVLSLGDKLVCAVILGFFSMGGISEMLEGAPLQATFDGLLSLALVPAILRISSIFLGCAAKTSSRGV